jgi:hypothetical protein
MQILKNMKKTLFFLIVMIIPLLLSSQDTKGRPDYINSGFYVKLGPVFPVGKYADGQSVPFSNISMLQLPYLPAKMGAAMDLGFLIYIGPSFANNYVRAGIDATFLSTWFNSTQPPIRDNLIEKYYTFIGQKFGPVITINPIDRLMVDLSYKLNANFGYHEELDGWSPLSDSQTSEYGYNLIGSEVSLAIRYRIMVFTFQYNFGSMNYNNADNTKPSQEIQTNTFRILLGFKF